MKTAFQLRVQDNVAVLLNDAGRETVQVLGAVRRQIELNEPISVGHKVALVTIAAGEPVVKYGCPIGRATRSIQRGDWVHLHNCASNCDARSSAFDRQSGAATDTTYE